MVSFTETQLETAKTVWNVLKSFGYNDFSIAGTIGNLYAESALNPNVNEHSGGGGYGLGQWTPKSNLYAQASACGLSNSEAETVEGQAKIIAQGDITGQWLNYGNTAYHPTVQNYQILSVFKQSSDLTSAAANFCAHWERPSVQYAHMNIRIDAANSIYQLLKGQEDNKIKGEISMQCIYWKKNNGQVNETAYYFNGISTVGISHGDQVIIIRKIYKDNNGKDIPEYHWDSGAPWYDRLEEVCEKFK